MQDIICNNCGLINEYQVKQTQLHTTAYCNGCGKYIKHLPKENKDHVIYFGKYKGTPLKDFLTKEHVNWLNWAVNNATTLKPALKEAILKHLGA